MSELWRMTNYIANINYITNAYIFEYDIEKANINILWSKGVIDDKTYNYLYNIKKIYRQIYIGKLLQNNYGLQSILYNGIEEVRRKLFESNNIKDNEVLSIKNDAIYVVNRELQITQFNNIIFRKKNTYTSFYRLTKFLEFYYTYNHITSYEKLDIKGFEQIQLQYHEDYMIKFFKDLFYTLQTESIEDAITKLKMFYDYYITLSLPSGFYREFNSISKYRFKDNELYYIDNITEDMKIYIDISYNIQYLMELQKILVRIYFSKH